MLDVKVSSKSTNDDGLDIQPNDLIQQNISAILSNGVHCSYLLNTMSNPSSLPYSNYTLGGSGSAQNKHNNHSNQKTASTVKSNANTNPSTPTAFDQRVGPITSNCKDQEIMSNMNINNIPLYIYSQNINHHYPQHQHHHYHLFQMAQHQQVGVGPYPLNPYNKYSNNNSLPVSPYILNPYDAHTTYTPHTPHNMHQTPGSANANTSKAPHNVHNVYPTIYDEGKDAQSKEPDDMTRMSNQIVSIPDEFVSAVNDDFSEMIGMQDVEQTEAIMTTDIDENEESKWENEAFISKRKEQIISFLKLWDTNYPDTSQNGEDHDHKCNKEGYDVPPGLEKKVQECNEEEGQKGKENDESWKYPSYRFVGSFSDAKAVGVRDNKWIMLNISDRDLFTAQWSNPLIWRHKRYGLIIEENFIFFNVMKFAESAQSFINFYDIRNVPSVCIIDPHSNRKRFEFVAPSTSTNIVKLRKDILDLLNRYAKPRKPPIPHHKYSVDIEKEKEDEKNNEKKEDNDDEEKKTKRRKNNMFTSSLSMALEPHIYCSSAPSTNIWDLCYPYTNLKNNAYILSTRQTFDWNDWMLIIGKSCKIIGAIPSEQHIEFLRNRNGEMTLESSGTYNGWWSEERIAQYVVNEKFGLSFEGGFASENGRKRQRFLSSLELPRRPTFKKMLVIIPNISNDDRVLFHENSLSITSYLEYDKMDNITSFQLWLSFITYLSVHMFETSSIYKNNQIKYNQCTNFCIKLGSKWKLPLTTLYNDLSSLISNEKCKEMLFSFPKIATDATTHSSSSCMNVHMHRDHINKYHNRVDHYEEDGHAHHKKHSGLEIAFVNKNKNKRTMLIKSYQGLQSALRTTGSDEIIDFPFPLCSSGWFSFNTLSLFATILEQHLNGTWVSMFSLNSRKQFKQIFDINKNTRRRSIIYTKLLQQKMNEENYKRNYINLSAQLSIKNQKRLKSFWNENRLYWTDLIIDPTNNNNNHRQIQQMNQENQPEIIKNHNNRNYRKKRKQRFRNRNRDRSK